MGRLTPIPHDADVSSISDEVARCVRPNTDPRSQENWYERRLTDGKHCVAMVFHQAWTLAFLMKHPQATWRAKTVAGCIAAYLVSPIQLIPSFIPVVGQLDDVFVLFAGMKIIRKWASPDVIADCEEQASRSATLQRFTPRSGNPANKRENILPEQQVVLVAPRD